MSFHVSAGVSIFMSLTSTSVYKSKLKLSYRDFVKITLVDGVGYRRREYYAQ